MPGDPARLETIANPTMGKAVGDAATHETFVQPRLQHPPLGDFDLRTQFPSHRADAPNQYVGAATAADSVQQDQDDDFRRSERLAALIAGNAVEVLDPLRL